MHAMVYTSLHANVHIKVFFYMNQSSYLRQMVDRGDMVQWSSDSGHSRSRSKLNRIYVKDACMPYIYNYVHMGWLHGVMHNI